MPTQAASYTNKRFRTTPSLQSHTGSSGVPASLHVFPSLQGEERTFPYTLFCTVSHLPRPLRVPHSRPCFATVFLAAYWSFLVGPRNPSTHASGELRFVPGECGHAAACVSHGSCFCGPVLSHHGHVIEAMGEREEAHGFPHGRSYVFFRSFFVSVVSFVSSSTTSSTASTVSTSVVSVISPLGSSSPSPGSRGCTCTCCLCIRRWTCTYVWPGRCVHLRFHRPCHSGGRPHALSPADGSLSFLLLDVRTCVAAARARVSSTRHVRRKICDHTWHGGRPNRSTNEPHPQRRIRGHRYVLVGDGRRSPVRLRTRAPGQGLSQGQTSVYGGERWRGGVGS